jgi:parallel beta-helix repeat protein
VDNVTFNGAGFWIDMTGVSGSSGVCAWYRNNVTVLDVGVRRASRGVYLFGTNNSVIRNVNTSTSTGVELACSSNNEVSGSYITTAYEAGIASWWCYDVGGYFYSHNNTIKDNIITNAGGQYYTSGVRLDNSTGDVITNNTILDCSRYGILSNYANDTRVVGNRIVNSSDIGIYLLYSNNATVTDNTVMGTRNDNNFCGCGMDLYYAGFYNLDNNTVCNSANYDFFCEGISGTLGGNVYNTSYYQCAIPRSAYCS